MDNFNGLEVIFFIGNIILFFLSKQTFNFLYKDDKDAAKPRIKISIFLASSLFFLQIFHILIGINLIEFYFNYFIIKIFYTLLTMYGMLISQGLVHYFIKVKLGTTDNIDNKEIVIDTPNSRMWALLAFVVLIFATIYINIQIWSAASLMETTGIVGISLGALALTNSVWFPDIYNGIIILKNKSFSVGDTVSFDNDDEFYIINKVTFFNLELLSIEDENRTTIPNHLLNTFKTHNLSKVASQKGLRRTIIYKIGYPKSLSLEEINKKKIELKKDKRYVDTEISNEFIKEKMIINFIEKVRKMALEAQVELLSKKGSLLSEHEFKIGIINTGDFAIEFVLSYYIKPLKRSFVTESIREYLIRVPLLVNEAMLIKSYKFNIDLSTPNLYQKKN